MVLPRVKDLDMIFFHKAVDDNKDAFIRNG